jgi:tetratricopeptide (TPR) repeat protein
VVPDSPGHGFIPLGFRFFYHGKKKRDMIKFHQKTFLKHLGLILITIFTGACDSPKWKDAQQFYNHGKYEEALLQYKTLLAKNPDSDIVHYHVGIAYYKKGDFEKAIEHFTKALATDDPVIEAWAAYNIGNSKYRLGEKCQKVDLKRTAEFYQEAIDYYKRAMELNGKDEAPKFNHDFVKKKWKDLLSHLKEQDAEVKKDPDHGTNAKGEKAPELIGRLQKDGPQKRGEKILEEGGKGLQRKGEKMEMSKEEAEKLLETYYLEEETKIEPKDRKRKREDPDLKKDW